MLKFLLLLLLSLCVYIYIFTICTHIVRIYIYVYTAPRKSWYVHLKKDIQQSNCIRNHQKKMQVYQASSWWFSKILQVVSGTCSVADMVPKFQSKLPNVQISTLRVEVISLRRIDIGIHWECWKWGLENSRKQKNRLRLIVIAWSWSRRVFSASNEGSKCQGKQEVHHQWMSQWMLPFKMLLLMQPPDTLQQLNACSMLLALNTHVVNYAFTCLYSQNAFLRCDIWYVTSIYLNKYIYTVYTYIHMYTSKNAI